MRYVTTWYDDIAMTTQAPTTAQWTQRGSLGPYWRLTVNDCPLCHKTHVHGGGNDPASPSYGHRAAHCRKPLGDGGYELVPA